MDTRLKIGLSVAVIALFAAGLWFGGLLKLGPAQAPSLDRELVFPSDFPAEARPILEGQVEELRARLQEHPEDDGAWLDLAIKYKAVNDFDGAIEIWEYLAGAKQNQVAYYNLGSIYHLELKQYARAEANFRKAIEVNPRFAMNYLGLHELYRYSYKQDSTLAADVLEEGIKSVIDTSGIDLMTALAVYYKERGEAANAIEWYTKAQSAAKLDGNTGLANQLQKEIDNLNTR